jgi:hypothetical protein
VRCFGEKEYSPEEALKNQQVLATLSGYKAFRHALEYRWRHATVPNIATATLSKSGPPELPR